MASKNKTEATKLNGLSTVLLCNTSVKLAPTGSW